MNPRLAGWVTRLYPHAWRERYGEEFEVMLEDGDGDLRMLCDSVLGALREHVIPTYRGGVMEHDTNAFRVLMRRPSAFVPVTMSLVALLVVLGAVAQAHITHQAKVHDPDQEIEHIWQLLMTVQVPIVLFFAIKWLRHAPGQTLRVLAVQAGAWLASCAPVYFFHLG